MKLPGQRPDIAFPVRPDSTIEYKGIGSLIEPVHYKNKEGEILAVFNFTVGEERASDSFHFTNDLGLYLEDEIKKNTSLDNLA